MINFVIATINFCAAAILIMLFAANFEQNGLVETMNIFLALAVGVPMFFLLIGFWVALGLYYLKKAFGHEWQR